MTKEEILALLKEMRLDLVGQQCAENLPVSMGGKGGPDVCGHEPCQRIFKVYRAAADAYRRIEAEGCA